jgi:hypothetical protein
MGSRFRGNGGGPAVLGEINVLCVRRAQDVREPLHANGMRGARP